jgi:pseudouridine-5'-phosphate glycosidase
MRPAVSAALTAKKPVVAVASSPLAHTLSWPANRETVRLAEEAVRQEGGTLAVVAIWKGRLTVGLDGEDLDTFTRSNTIQRASRRDLPALVVGGQSAATTVSSSMYLAHRAGIRVLVTTALGAARSQAQEEGAAWDISSDLVELSRTPVAVVSSGVRSGSSQTQTAEVLETFRVPVIGYTTDTFPIFYMRVGSSSVSSRANTPAEVAAQLKAHWGMDGAGVAVVQPTPAEVALSPDELLPALRMVEELAEKDRIARKDLSPFLIDKLNRLTWGKSLRAYQATLIANARLGAQIARELA